MNRSNVWLCLPSAKPRCDANASLKPWMDKGYRLAVFRDAGMEPIDADLLIFDQYFGYPKAANQLCRAVFSAFPSANVCVCAGDDMEPASTPPEEIERRFLEHFSGTMGVLQPTGDPYGIDASGRCAAERICGSPWLGRSFVESRCGKPFSEAYWHFFADEQMHDELINTPLLWQNREWCQKHNHYHITGKQAPPYMARHREIWAKDELVFREWKSSKG